MLLTPYAHADMIGVGYEPEAAAAARLGQNHYFSGKNGSALPPPEKNGSYACASKQLVQRCYQRPIIIIIQRVPEWDVAETKLL